MRKICENCGAYYDSWDGRCDCEEKDRYESEVTENERNIDIQQINLGNE